MGCPFLKGSYLRFIALETIVTHILSSPEIDAAILHARWLVVGALYELWIVFNVGQRVRKFR